MHRAQVRAVNRRTKLGAWTLPSGNSVDAYFVRDPAGAGLLVLEWDVPPPLCHADELDYAQTILPAIVRRVREYLELVGPAVLVLA